MLLATDIRIMTQRAFRVHVDARTKVYDRTILRLETTYYSVGSYSVDILCNWHYPVPERTQHYLDYDDRNQ